jgi:hypothetical protein
MFVREPVKLGLWVDVVTKFNPLMLSIIATVDTAFSELLPTLSTALMKYVPVIAGTITVLAGLETLSAMSIELA